MKIRASRISASIARAISRNITARGVLRRVLQFFAFFKLLLARYRPADFLALRSEVWELDEDEYLDSFQVPDKTTRSRKGKDRESELVPVGDLGYSGSTFFTTPNAKYLIKSLPRRFEHEFFTHDLFDAYMQHVHAHPESLLVRITDMAYTPHATLGGIMGTAPTHHIVMENLLYGKEQEEEDLKNRWETYDLKPSTYFFPERDIADGKLAPDSVKDKLVDDFPDTIRVTPTQKKELLAALDADTKLLADKLAVDYSLFLVRYPGPDVTANRQPVAAVKSRASAWRTGIDDVEGNWTYRAVVLDFFWAKHKLRAKAMTGLVNTFNLVANKGPMSITADPAEYRERFMKMVDEMVVGQSY
jgi:hypothetical protein